MMSGTHKPQPLGTVIESIVDRLGIRKQLDAATVVEAWAVLAGERINGVTDSVRLRGEVLYVTIRSAAWRQELHLRRTSWRDRLNESLGGPVIREIVFR